MRRRRTRCGNGPSFLELRGGRFRGGCIEIGDGDFRAFTRKYNGDFLADAARGAGDERAPVDE